MIADRLVNELMLVSVLVAGEGAAAFAGQLEAAGAAAETIAEGAPQPGFDLAILLAKPESAADPAMADCVAALSGASDRLLFAPLPLRDAPETGDSQRLPLNEWFELFAEHGYQPVVDFDADFVAAGAFLVDRQATAAESELAAFADRLQNPAAPAPRETAPMSAPEGAAERDALRAEIAALQAHIAALTQSSAAPDSDDIDREAAEISGWDALAPWVNAIVADPQRNTEALLRAQLPRLRELRGPDAPELAVSPTEAPDSDVQARSWLKRWMGRFLRRSEAATGALEAALLDDTALVRASRFFDAAWYIASTPELLAGESLDPVFHYVIVGSLRNADPGPWFNTTAYLAATPQAAGSCALVHAIRSGEAERLWAAQAP